MKRNPRTLNLDTVDYFARRFAGACHVSNDDARVARYALGAMQRKTALAPESRRALYLAACAAHRENRERYVAVMTGRL